MDSTWYNYHMDNTVGSLTRLQKSIIIGTILGDGYLRILPRSINAILEINHSAKQKEYVDWIYSKLRNVVVSSPKTRKGNGGRIAYRFYTKQLPEITHLYKIFYKDGQKIIPEHLSLDAISLAVWYMDDGSRCGDINFYLNTQQFCSADQEKLRNSLEKLGLATTLNKDKKYHRIRFYKSSITPLKKLIGSIVIPSMQYKLG